MRRNRYLNAKAFNVKITGKEEGFYASLELFECIVAFDSDQYVWRTGISPTPLSDLDGARQRVPRLAFRADQHRFTLQLVDREPLIALPALHIHPAGNLSGSGSVSGPSINVSAGSRFVICRSTSPPSIGGSPSSLRISFAVMKRPWAVAWPCILT